jgi:hypothetical protein
MRLRILILFFSLSICDSALAVIQLKLTVSKMYSSSSPVMIAKVVSLNEANRVIEADVTETLSGQASPKIRLQIIQPQNLVGKIKVGNPIVLMAAKGRGAGDASIHLGDTWLLARAKPDSNPPIWQITQEQSNDFTKAYPGTTESLAKLVRELKSGKSSFMDKAEERLFGEGASEVAQLKITPGALFGADVNDEKVLLIATAHGPRVFSKSGENYQDVTAKYSLPESGQLLAVGDLDGDSKPDLLIDKTPYLLKNNSFKAGAALDIPAKAELLAITIANGRIYALSRSGQFSNGIESHQLWNDPTTAAGAAPSRAAIIGAFDEGEKICAIVAGESSLTRYSLDGRAADFTRLTGEAIATYLKDSGGKFKNPKLVPLDANGDGRHDLLVLSEGANFLLINRGFGAYFVSPAAASLALGLGPDKSFPYAASATSSHWDAIDTRGDHHEDLLILTPDGALYRLGNPPPK